MTSYINTIIFQCQGETLEEVLIDFGAEKKIRNYIIPGSFYVAITRVKNGCKVFLRSFERSYIVTDKRIAEIIDSMRKYRAYNYKKIHLDEKIFVESQSEMKIGYLNINGVGSKSHTQYLNSDHNLKNLDILALAETKIQKNHSMDQLRKDLCNWNIFGRYDANDGANHMGLLLLTSKDNRIADKIECVTNVAIKRGGSLHCQGIIVKVESSNTFGFVYCRTAPNKHELEQIKTSFNGCICIMGDLNLSHRLKEERLKIEKLCEPERFSALKEITRSASNNQLDYILLHNMCRDSYLTGSFHNFISDHKTIFLRLPDSQNNKLTNKIKEKITFDSESHLKQAQSLNDSKLTASEDELSPSDCDTPNAELSDKEEEVDTYDNVKNRSFTDQSMFLRRFQNQDKATCWLNSCLQLLLLAVDYHGQSSLFFSELGRELLRLQTENTDTELNPSTVKNILVAAEDLRIAVRLSELSDERHNDDLRRRISNSRLDLLRGQQCIRDLFVCLQVNNEAWPDVCSLLNFEMTSSTPCPHCNNISQSNSDYLFIEMSVPPVNMDFISCIDGYFSNGTQVESRCNLCNKYSVTVNKTTLTDVSRTKFIVVVLSRAQQGNVLNKNNVTVTGEVTVR